MSIRIKLILFLVAFVVIAVMFGLGSIFVFNRISSNLEVLMKISVEHKLHEDLKGSIIKSSTALKNWAFTGERRYMATYWANIKDVRKHFGALHDIQADKESLTETGRRFEELNGIAAEIVSFKDPIDSPGVLRLITAFDEKEIEVLNALRAVEGVSIERINISVLEAEALKKKLTWYMLFLLVFTVISVFFFIMLIRRSIGRPFKELLDNTERIATRGVYRITDKSRSDEFGVIAQRFDDVLLKLKESEDSLKRRLSETELLLDVTRIAISTLEVGDSLNMISATVAERMGIDYVGVYLFNRDTLTFNLQASNVKDGVFERSFVLEQDGLCGRVLNTMSVISRERPERGETPFIKSSIGSILVLPLLKEERCHGTLVLATEEERRFTEGEQNIASILANSISTVIRNAELYTSTIRQLNKISVLYELSNALTTVMDLEGLLRKVTVEVTRLLNAKGCIIRLQEGGKLKIKSYYGVPDDIVQKMEIEVGEGIVGKVAQTGRPTLVEDVSKMPEDLRVPHLEVRSAVCVPLRIGMEVIGTIGLYDKMNPEGDIVRFDHDDLKTTEGFASIISLAIEKARLFERQVQREKEAIEAGKRLDLLFESVQSGIVTLDRQYRITSVNRYAEDLLQIKAEDVVGESSISVFHEKGGICPHCVAVLTFDTGSINLITQTKGTNYAELSSYPVLDENGEVVEAVVLIQNITDRILYQEEIITLYKEVAQTKEYLESIIDNSADAIVASDINGIVTSWNRGAERIYGYTEEEVTGSFLPFIPDFLMETERQYLERIKKGETVKDIETLRKRKDGRMIEVSLTLSPIKDATGEIIGVSGISRDISEKKKVEKELIRRNQELSRLFFISSAMRGTLELERLLRMVLTAVTMSDGLGFNRAILFLLDEKRGVLRGEMGVGPSSSEEAWQIWERLSIEKKTLVETLKDIEEGPLRKDSFLDRLSTGLEVDVHRETALSLAIKEKRSFNIHDARHDPLADPEIIQQLGSEAYAIIPLVVRDRVIGVLWVDNYFNRKTVTEEDMRFLSGFSNQVASAIESARLFEQVKLAEAELENIFESISDLLYITTEDYTIRRINRAVSEKVGMSKEEVVGRKCYEIFHGMDRPYEKCPHHKTVETHRAYIEEFEDPYRGWTTLTSTSPLFDLTGKFLGTIHIVRDISELKKLREKLLKAERMAALGEVAAKVAHEIRNPLVSIGGFSRRLENKLDGQLRDYASIISREVGRLEGILRDILSFVKEIRITKERIRVSFIIHDILTLYSRAIKKKGIIVDTELDDSLELDLDVNRLKEALINIISNAIDMLERDGRLTIRLYGKGDYGVVEVADTGPGIKERDLPFIFDPFFTTKIDGTGLGLAIAHSIIEEHGGRIEVSSSVGEGTTFKVYLPLRSEG